MPVLKTSVVPFALTATGAGTAQDHLDTSVLVGGADGNANCDRVAVRATVETDATDEQFATLVTETERRCPVSQLFKRSGLEWDSQWTKADPAPPGHHGVRGNRLDGPCRGRPRH
jgi:hypothetical protein